MINLKLAEYNLETGKFKKFLELSKVELRCNYNHEIEFDNDGFLLGKDCVNVLEFCGGYNIDAFYKDEKDPLNRFDGLFNGRTYGDGRFVLIEKGFDNLWIDDVVIVNNCGLKYKLIKNNKMLIIPEEKIVGNLHKKPELWKNIKND